jgi:multiple sugar transport system permease protein
MSIEAPATTTNVHTTKAGTSTKSRRRTRRLDHMSAVERRSALFFLAPWAIGMLVFTLGPVLGSLYLSFTDYDLFNPPQWIGFRNYVTMFTGDPRWWHSVGVTFTYVAISVPLVVGFALALALILDTGMRLLPLYRALFYLPSLLGSSVAISLLWRQVFGQYGLVNGALSWIGIQGPNWLGDPDTIIYALIALNVWTFGSAMIIFLAALRQIPRDLYEAAIIDGAGPVRRFFSVTLPLITPVLLFNTILNVIHSFQAFTPAFVLSKGTGGPVDATLFYTLYLYMRGFSFFEMGYASAMAWVLLLGIAVVTAVILWSSRRWVYYADSRDGDSF